MTHHCTPRMRTAWAGLPLLGSLLAAISTPLHAELRDPFRLPPPEGVTDLPVIESDAGPVIPEDPPPAAVPPPTPEAPRPAPERLLTPIPLHHADAGTLAHVVSADGAGLLSEFGRVTIDTRTNTLILHDTPERVRAARTLIRQLDQPVAQIVIEARIVLTSGEYASQLGRRLGVTTRRGSGSLGRRADPAPGVDGDDGFLIDLGLDGTPPGQIGVSIGRIGRTLLQMELSAMEAEGQGQVVSAPRVLTAARREATIRQGVQIPFQEIAESGATAVAFREATLSLTATPSVSADGRIELSLEVTKDAVGQIFEGVPSIDTQVLSTHLHLEDGETAVLGGVQEQESHSESRRVPWFADLPGIGWMFQGRQERERHSELLVFVTPRIWE